MFWYKRALGVVLGCWLAIPVCAFTFSYGTLFDVKEVQNDKGVLRLPLTSKKYTNVKILSKAVYEFLQQCPGNCTYPVTETVFVSTDYRAAGAQGKMLVAEVEFNEEVRLTFLAFKQKNGTTVRLPAAVEFKDKKLEQRVREYVAALAEQTL